MTQRTIRLDLELWNNARRKAGLFGSLSAVIRKFLWLWVEGKINLDDYPDYE